MDDIQERRNAQVPRVPVSTVVEICGSEPGVPAFEAESIDVSKRGMHVRTAYVPDVGDPLVCRFENKGSEIVVEGVVAWRKPEGDKGEFGIQFTALDSNSVEALRALCSASGPACTASGEEAPAAQPTSGAKGDKVRLHIDGLGTPMKARVRHAMSRRVEVGSNLEFLRVGRRLEVERSDGTDRRSAWIDAVNVAVDAQTQVPQLIVSLRYTESEETTPEPSVIHFDGDVGASAETDVELATSDAGKADSAAADAADADPAEIADRLEHAAASAAAMARATAGTLLKVGSQAATGLGVALRSSGKLFAKLPLKRRTSEPPRRKTSSPPGGALSVNGGRAGARPAAVLRSQKGGAPEPAQPKKGLAALARPEWLTPRRGAAGLAALTLLVAVVWVAWPSSGNDQAVADGSQVSAAAEQTAQAAAAAGVAAPAGGAVANVPLFGPTPMATMEPAPLGPPPDANLPDELGADEEAALESEEAREKAAALATVAKDEKFPRPVAQAAPAPAAPEAEPTDTKPWGAGKMNLPTIHRLRLDGRPTKLQGSVTANGFVVKIPGRKVMESPRGIEQRDRRISRVRVNNEPSLAQVSFQFKGPVPAYRVRLRKDFVEFLISAPDKASR